MLKRTLAVMGVALGFSVAMAAPAFSASIGTGAGRISAGVGRSVTQVQCWNCGWGGGVVVGTGFAPVFAPSVVYSPGVVYAVPQVVVPQVVVPQVVVQPVVVPQVVVPQVVVPQVVVAQPVVPVVPVLVPASCWHETDNRGFGYWGACWGR